MKNLSLAAACAAAASFFAAPAMAAPVYYSNDIVTDRAAFQAAASGVTLSTESFEGSFSDGASIDFGDFTVESSAGNLSQEDFARGVTDGTYALGFFESSTEKTVTFTFDNAINFFGVDVNDLSFVSMSFMDDLGNVLNDALLQDNGGALGGSGFENLQFFGLSNAVAFSVVQLTFSAADQGLSGFAYFDNLQFGALPTSEVPLPAALPLFLVGLAGVGGFTRRKRAK